MLAAELEKTRRLLKNKYEEDLGDVLKNTKAQAQKIKHQAERQMQAVIEQEKKLREDMKKISDLIQKQMYEEKEKQKINLFQKIGEKINRDSRINLKIVGGKKN